MVEKFLQREQRALCRGWPPGGCIGVRDSKDADGPVLCFTLQAWNAFLRELRPGEPPGRGPRYLERGQAVAGSPVNADDLFGYCGQIRAGDVRRGAEWAEHHGGVGDECGLASGGQGRGDVPGMSGDKAHLTDRYAAALGYRVVGTAVRA